ncbi:MAG TPA: ATP-binding protein [Verrucomicrobiota bacterium]|nr:ATP-binding protein [Verrucomicrobiota bacterium]HNU49932.1 ATP-binding protein [Verrucomicrobiota bacterium]
MNAPAHAFLRQAGRILNSGQARTVVLTGNLYDFFAQSRDSATEYLPLLGFLTANWNLPGLIVVVYELNGPIRFARDGDAERMRDAWLRWRTGCDANELAVRRMLAKGPAAAELDAVVQTYDDTLRRAVSSPTLALEMLRQMCLCSRSLVNGKRPLADHLLILIEGADLLMPDAPVASLSDTDRQRISICQDWFSDPGFLGGGDSVVLLAESRSLLHHRLARLPQLLEVEIASPDEPARRHFIDWFAEHLPPGLSLQLWSTPDELAKLTAGLSLQALMQLLRGAAHENRPLAQAEVIAKVEEFIQSQLGEDIVEFKKPGHQLRDVVGFRRLKAFLREEFMPRLAASGAEALPGAAVCGPIGGGKTYIFEAVAAELDMVVLVLKNIRSQWFGQTDVLFERLRRVLHALSKVLIFVDEADTQFGGVGPDTHATERRLTGKIQAMMSDPALRGRVFWLLVTARIHLLSPDLRRPGRVGDLIIPTLDPEGEDRLDFLRWSLESALDRELPPADIARFDAATRGYSAAAFASLRSELKARKKRLKRPLTPAEVFDLVADLLPPAIEDTRRYQALQALVNCTRRSLLPDPKVSPEQRRAWENELRQLEASGVR